MLRIINKCEKVTFAMPSLMSIFSKRGQSTLFVYLQGKKLTEYSGCEEAVQMVIAKQKVVVCTVIQTTLILIKSRAGLTYICVNWYHIYIYMLPIIKPRIGLLNSSAKTTVNYICVDLNIVVFIFKSFPCGFHI